MPCNDSEEDMNVGLPPPRSDRAKMAGNPGPAQPDSDPEVTDAQLEKCLEEPKGTSGGPRKWNGKGDYTCIKRWVTGDEAMQDEEDIQRELFEHARDWMEASKLRKTPGHKSLDTDFALWKAYRETKSVKKGLVMTMYRCPMNYRCGCNAGI